MKSNAAVRPAPRTVTAPTGPALSVETGKPQTEQGWLARLGRGLFATEADATQTLLRVALAGIMFPHGAQKALGWFGGYGFGGTMGFFTETLGIPWLLALLVIVAEFVGPIGLVFGLFGRVGALGIASVMVGAILTTHVQHGFFMNWTGAQAGEGFEFHIAVIAMTIALMIRGSGALSLDRLITRKAYRSI